MNDKCIISLIFELREKLNKYLMKVLKEQNLEGLCKTHACVLEILSNPDQEYFKMVEISEMIKRSKSTISEHINKLEKLGYITRTECKSDNRSIYISITEEGNEVLENLKLVNKLVLDKFQKDFSDGEKLLLHELIKKSCLNFD